MRKIILVGNPNAGKTTLFNTLTSSNEKVGNWHGVTVGIKSKTIQLSGEDFEVCDTPGVYSLNGYSNEEKITTNFLKKHKDELIINICDSQNLKRSFILTKMLIDEGYNILVVINIFSKQNYENITNKNNLRNIITIRANDKNEVLKLKTNIANNLIQKTQKISKTSKIMPINQKTLQNVCDICENKSKTNMLKLDKIIYNKVLFPVVFIISVFLVFYLTFGWFGCLISSIFDIFLLKINNILQNLILCLNISNVIQMLLIDGVLLTVFSVLKFIPQITLLMLFMNLLEESGFMSRIAFMLDGFLKKIGLTGKSVFSLILGFGCTTSAVLTTRNLQNVSQRKRTILMLPFINCSAKLPVILVIISLFFEKYKYLYVFGFYLFSIIISIIVSIIYNKITKTNDEFFILEMPRLQVPSFKKLLKDTLLVVKEFCFKVGSIILLFGVLGWFLRNFNLKLQFLNNSNFTSSILFNFSNLFSDLFKPLGLNNAGVISSFALGLVAKELVLVGLALINGVELLSLQTSLVSASSVCHFSPISSIIFLIFLMLYSPCISAVGTIKNELGFKYALFVFLLQLIIAYIVAFLCRCFLLFETFRIILCFLIILDILIVLMLKLSRKKKYCRGNCNECRHI